MVAGTQMLIALFIGIVLLILLILKTKVHAFLGLIIAAVVIGLLGGMAPASIPTSIINGFGGTLGSIGIIIGFGVRPDGKARSAAEREGVEIRCYDVIYKCLEELDAARIGMLKPTEVEVATGTATVLDTFKVPKVGIAAGVRVEEGEIAATDSVRLVRDGIVVFNGKIASMRHYKDEAKSLKSGSEGGIGLENFQDIKPGDQIEGYRIDQVARTE